MNQIRTRATRAFSRILFSAISLFLISGAALPFLDLGNVHASASAVEKTLVLYDSASGAIPSAPLMNFIDVPAGAAMPTFSDGVTVMDSTAAGKATYAGWVSSEANLPEFPQLDRAAGFQVNFIVQLELESHANNSRAGFSVLVLGEDARGIELAFWQDEIWAQNDNATGGLFTHGEGVAFPTTSGRVAYQLAILNDTYTLTADANQILTGPVRDYTQFTGFPDPYETPNFLFLGDDTTSAETRVQLSLLSITGTESITPTATSPDIPTSSPAPPPTDSPVPLPSATPIPSPTPAPNGFEACPLSGLLVLMSAAMVIKRTYRKAIPPEDLDEK